MATWRQIAANRRNAQKSTGPRSAAGKAASSANALVHGFTAARTLVLADEDEAVFHALRQDVIADLDPLDVVQAALAQRIAILLWRLERASRLEAEIFEYGELRAQRSRERAQGDGEPGDPCGSDDEEMRAGAPLAALLVEDEASARAFERLARHEGALQRALERTLREFTRLRAGTAAAAEAGVRAREAAASGDDAPESWARRAVRGADRNDAAPEFRSPASGAPQPGACTAPTTVQMQNSQNEANSPQVPDPTLAFEVGIATPSPLTRPGPWSGMGETRAGLCLD